MDPNTNFHFATLNYVQNASQNALDTEPLPLEWPLRLAASLLQAILEKKRCGQTSPQTADSETAPMFEPAAS
jgi:hypothetical protein